MAGSGWKGSQKLEVRLKKYDCRLQKSDCRSKSFRIRQLFGVAHFSDRDDQFWNSRAVLLERVGTLLVLQRAGNEENCRQRESSPSSRSTFDSRCHARAVTDRLAEDWAAGPAVYAPSFRSDLVRRWPDRGGCGAGDLGALESWPKLERQSRTQGGSRKRF